MSGKGHRRRPTEVPFEESELKWAVTFSKSYEERCVATTALKEYFDKRKKSYVEKRTMRM